MVLLVCLLGYSQRIVNKELAHTARNQHHQYHAVSGTISEWTSHGQWIMSVHRGDFVFARSKHCCIHCFLRFCQMNSWILILVTCLSYQQWPISANRHKKFTSLKNSEILMLFYNVLVVLMHKWIHPMWWFNLHLQNIIYQANKCDCRLWT